MVNLILDAALQLGVLVACLGLTGFAFHVAWKLLLIMIGQAARSIRGEK